MKQVDFLRWPALLDLPSHVVFMLANVPVHDIAKDHNISQKQVYAKYAKHSSAENS